VVAGSNPATPTIFKIPELLRSNLGAISLSFRSGSSGKIFALPKSH
jgi:hypothetical protein